MQEIQYRNLQRRSLVQNPLQKFKESTQPEILERIPKLRLDPNTIKEFIMGIGNLEQSGDTRANLLLQEVKSFNDERATLANT